MHGNTFSNDHNHLMSNIKDNQTEVYQTEVKLLFSKCNPTKLKSAEFEHMVSPKQCEEKCPSTQAMLVGKLWESRKVMEQEKKIGSRSRK